MHRHEYKGRKFGRERDQRRALMKGLAVSLVEHGKIETTLPKAKDLVPYMEKLITKAKKGDLHNRRLVISQASVPAAHKLFDEIVPKLKGRDSGHLKIERTALRRGDMAQLATVSFVDSLSQPAKPAAADTKTAAPAKTAKTSTAKAKVKETK